ncbi:MAG: GreA/GreB family elongation factor [Clostridia bacterium]|nr:GreA/GreB family elongation factor [Clostridia bacterium]
MHNELTKVDIKKMQDEIDYRVNTLRPQLLEEVKRTREYGDLSENAEYKIAKSEKNKNESRIRYLKAMIDTAKIIDVRSEDGKIGLFDTVELFMEDEGEVETIQIVTTLRQNTLAGLVSKDSPIGRALLGHKVGDRVKIKVNETYSYFATVRSIKKGKDDESIPIRSY